MLLGNGDGTFGRRANYVIGIGSYPGFVAMGDLNGDGRADLVATNTYSGTVSVLLANGDGTLGAKRDYARAAFPRP